MYSWYVYIRYVSTLMGFWGTFGPGSTRPTAVLAIDNFRRNYRLRRSFPPAEPVRDTFAPQITLRLSSLTHLPRTKHCWQNYVDYYKCVEAKGDDFRPCKQVHLLPTSNYSKTTLTG